MPDFVDYVSEFERIAGRLGIVSKMSRKEMEGREVASKVAGYRVSSRRIDPEKEVYAELIEGALYLEDGRPIPLSPLVVVIRAAEGESGRAAVFTFQRDAFDAAVSAYEELVQSHSSKRFSVLTPAAYLVGAVEGIPGWMDADIVMQGTLYPLKLSRSGRNFYRKKNWRTYPVQDTLSGVGVKPGLGVLVRDFLMYKSYESVEFATYKQKPINPIAEPLAVIEDGLWKFQWNTGVCADVFRRTMKADTRSGVIEVTVPSSKFPNIDEDTIQMAFDASGYEAVVLPGVKVFYLPQLRLLMLFNSSELISDEECDWRLGWEERGERVRRRMPPEEPYPPRERYPYYEEPHRRWRRYPPEEEPYKPARGYRGRRFAEEEMYPMRRRPRWEERPYPTRQIEEEEVPRRPVRRRPGYSEEEFEGRRRPRRRRLDYFDEGEYW